MKNNQPSVCKGTWKDLKVAKSQKQFLTSFERCKGYNKANSFSDLPPFDDLFSEGGK